MSVVVTRCLWEEEDAAAENGGEQKAETFWDSPGGRLAALVLKGSEVDA